MWIQNWCSMSASALLLYGRGHKGHLAVERQTEWDKRDLSRCRQNAAMPIRVLNDYCIKPFALLRAGALLLKDQRYRVPRRVSDTWTEWTKRVLTGSFMGVKYLQWRQLLMNNPKLGRRALISLFQAFSSLFWMDFICSMLKKICIYTRDCTIVSEYKTIRKYNELHTKSKIFLWKSCSRALEAC